MKKNLMILISIWLIQSGSAISQDIHVWEMKELSFRAENKYGNPYTDVSFWIDLTGPDFNKRVYGFWDGGQTFRVRVVATAPGEWSWTSGSNQEDDKGLHQKSGSFTATSWTPEEILENPNRRGFIRATANGHAFEYADGTPFYFKINGKEIFAQGANMIPEDVFLPRWMMFLILDIPNTHCPPWQYRSYYSS